MRFPQLVLRPFKCFLIFVLLRTFQDEVPDDRVRLLGPKNEVDEIYGVIYRAIQQAHDSPGVRAEVSQADKMLEIRMISVLSSYSSAGFCVCNQKATTVCRHLYALHGF